MSLKLNNLLENTTGEGEAHFLQIIWMPSNLVLRIKVCNLMYLCNIYYPIDSSRARPLQG